MVESIYQSINYDFVLKVALLLKFVLDLYSFSQRAISIYEIELCKYRGFLASYSTTSNVSFQFDLIKCTFRLLQEELWNIQRNTKMSNTWTMPSSG